MKPTRFSLLLSVHGKDSPTFLHEALASVEKNTVKPNEFILVADGPLPKGIDQIIANFTPPLSIKIIQLNENRGLGNALSIGLHHCSEEWVARFDSDDLCHPQRFEKQLQFIETHPEISILSSWVAEFDNCPENYHAIRKVPTEHGAIMRGAKLRNPFNHMAVIYKKSAVLNAGNYQDDYLYEDYALWVRMLMNGCIAANIPEALVYARTGNGMAARRGGLKYARSEIRAQNSFRRIGFISTAEFLRNILVRTPARLIPKALRQWLYRTLLRK